MTDPYRTDEDYLKRENERLVKLVARLQQQRWRRLRVWLRNGLADLSWLLVCTGFCTGLYLVRGIPTGAVVEYFLRGDPTPPVLLPRPSRPGIVSDGDGVIYSNTTLSHTFHYDTLLVR